MDTLNDCYKKYKDSCLPEGMGEVQARMLEVTYFAGLKNMAQIVIELTNQSLTEEESDAGFKEVLNQLDTFAKGVLDEMSPEILESLGMDLNNIEPDTSKGAH